MNTSAADMQVVESLKSAISRGVLEEPVNDHATHLLTRLTSPVRVTLLGLPGTGKTEVINMFLRKRVFPRNARMPTMELVYGEKERIYVTTKRGNSTVFESLDFPAILELDPAFLRFELPIDLLKKISFLEVVTSGGIDELSSAIDWASRRTDIAIWCTQVMGEDERVLWNKVPDGIKDHSYLVLTKADVLSSRNQLADRGESLNDIASEEFHAMFPVATLHAIRAHAADGTVDEAKFHGSGGSAFVGDVQRHANRGHRADFDSAHLFVARHNIEKLLGEGSADAKDAKAPEIPEQKITAPAAANSPSPAEAETVDESPVVTADLPPGTLDNEVELFNPELFQSAARFIQKRGASISENVADNADEPPTDVVEKCIEALEELVDMFSNDDSGCPMSEQFLDELHEASDLMVLMQVESGDAPAADAVTLLLQLRRDIETALAA